MFAVLYIGQQIEHFFPFTHAFGICIINMGLTAGGTQLLPGGQILATGTPEDLARVPESWTGEYLADMLGIKRKSRKSA